MAGRLSGDKNERRRRRQRKRTPPKALSSLRSSSIHRSILSNALQLCSSWPIPERLPLQTNSRTVVCFSEAWLQENLTIDAFLLIPNFSCDRSKDNQGGNGGGLLLYALVPDDLCTATQKRADSETNAIGLCLAFELLHDSRNVFRFAYRPPDLSPAIFYDCEPLHTPLAAAAPTSASLLNCVGLF